jgi:DNA (cytosine-5)-methyltransferase 1
MGMGGGYIPMVYDNHSQDSRITECGDVGPTVAAKWGTGGNNQPLIVSNGASGVVTKGNGEAWLIPEKATSLTLGGGQAGQGYPAVCIGNGQANQFGLSDKVGALNCMHDQQAVITYGIDRAAFNQGLNAAYKPQITEELSATCVAKGPNAVYQSVVRRLTPLECERLQGYPGGYTDIGEWVDSKGKTRKTTDSARYKALGNSVALPFWFWLLRRISAQYERVATLGSLFDGIGGFPLCWERCNGKGTALWASEIEEFPIAVTKARFPECTE